MFRGVLGILIGAGLYSEVYPYFKDSVLKLGDYGKVTIPVALDVNPWFVIMPFAVVTVAFLAWAHKR